MTTDYVFSLSAKIEEHIGVCNVLLRRMVKVKGELTNPDAITNTINVEASVVTMLAAYISMQTIIRECAGVGLTPTFMSGAESLIQLGDDHLPELVKEYLDA